MARRIRYILAIAAALLCLACAAQVKPGIEVLRDRNFEGLKGKRVGLLTNPSGVDRNLKSTIDILHENVNLVAIFAPEHGARGNIYAGGHVSDEVDEATGLPIFSVYGDTRKPTPKMLQGIDIVVYDIQDVGSRSYTFISSLGLMMQACAQQGIEVMVLDRPNPLGGLKVEGSYPEPGFVSFVSQFRIPYIYGLTVGELAQMINEEGLNRGQLGKDEPVRCKLTVIPMEGWSREMLFEQTGLPWVLPSPNIPYPQSAIGYPSAGLVGEFSNYLNIGIGYTLPFGVFAAEWLDADKLVAKLDSYNIPGVAFRPIHFTPTSGSSRGKLIHGVQYFYTDFEAATITLTQFYVMQAVHELAPSHNPFVGGSYAMFDKCAGSDKIRNTFSKSFKVSDIATFWNKDVQAFKELSKVYYLY